ncbi:MAG TPA: sulfite exporter TauE/SafE family protein [Bacillota bacterium]
MSLGTFLGISALGIVAGTMGAMVGLGGGILVVPLLTLVFGVPIHNSIGASIVAVIATSSAAASTYVRDRLTNVRLGMTMETLTTAGAVTGGLVAGMVGKEILSGIFGTVMVLVAATMFRRKSEGRIAPRESGDRLGGHYYDPYAKKDVSYRVRNLPIGLATSFLAGNLSGLLGVGGGVIKVPAMTLGMGVPVKAATATSNFMIGVTAVASAFIYFSRGMIDPVITAPAAIGVFLGARFGAHIAPRIRTRSLLNIFVLVMLAMAVQMILNAFGIDIR